MSLRLSTEIDQYDYLSVVIFVLGGTGLIDLNHRTTVARQAKVNLRKINQRHDMAGIAPYLTTKS